MLLRLPPWWRPLAWSCERAWPCSFWRRLPWLHPSRTPQQMQCGVPINKCSVIGVLKLGQQHRTVSIAHYHPRVGNIVRPEDLVQASDERGRGVDVSLEHSSFNFEWLRNYIHRTRQSNRHDTGCCGEDGLDDASHLRLTQRPQARHRERSDFLYRMPHYNRWML